MVVFLESEVRVPITLSDDILEARRKGREMGAALGFTSTDQAVIATAISELARNILLYARRGEVLLWCIEDGVRRGIQITAKDKGPGIPDIRLAMQDGWSTSGGLGLGLPGVKRLMDEFDLASKVGEGTVVTAKIWCKKEQ